jgi:hypothetical protein
MDEYLIEVKKDGSIETLKSFCASPIEALDSMISFEDVSHIYKITHVKTNENWEFDNSSLEDLRKLRNVIDDESTIIKELRRN